MGADSGQAGHSGRPWEGGQEPWAPPQQDDPLRKRPADVSGEPTVSAMPGAGAPGPGATTPPGSPVGPPPPAPGAPQSASAYGAQGGYGTGGYGAAGAQAGYGGYGYGGYQQTGVAWGGPPPSQGTAVASMVLGIVGLVLTASCWGSFVGIFVAPLALILGVSARRKADRGEGGGRSYATSGFVMGIVGTALSVIIAALLIVGLVMAERSDDRRYGTSGGDDFYDALRTPASVAVIG
jgi:hypothetical protein